MGKKEPLSKTRWHPLSLQALSPPKFSSVVNRILCGDLAVLNSRFPHHDKKVLVTDDNRDHIETIVEYLETDLGVLVDIARSPDECLKKLQTSSYDLLILDYRLPKHTGLWVIDQICRRGRRVPVLMMTSFFSDELSRRISRDYPVEIMSKSSSFRMIARRAGRMLASTSAGPIAS
ncbi:response regulator [Candidatus Zixiibacteriota bacterium]